MPVCLTNIHSTVLLYYQLPKNMLREERETRHGSLKFAVLRVGKTFFFSSARNKEHRTLGVVRTSERTLTHDTIQES